jgi:hypothetical protein
MANYPDTLGPFVVRSGYDRRKHPTQYRVRYLTEQEALDPILDNQVEFRSLDQHGELRYIRRGGKTQRWKTDPRRISIPMKYGMYEAFRLDLAGITTTLVVVLQKQEPGKDWEDIDA